MIGKYALLKCALMRNQSVLHDNLHLFCILFCFVFFLQIGVSWMVINTVCVSSVPLVHAGRPTY